MKQLDVLASAQIIMYNPILKENTEMKIQYFIYLRKLLHLVKWDKRKYTKAQIDFYKKILCGENLSPRFIQEANFPVSLCYLMPYDLSLMVAYHEKFICTEKITTVINKIVTDFNLPVWANDFLYREFDAALGDNDAWHEVLNNKTINGYKRYLKVVRNNISFVRRCPYNILITATMSAGKSTLINALVGKNISLTQNMACTSKIHTIISKPFEDGVTSEYDHELSMDATKEELLSDSEDNMSTKILVGTYFNSLLGGKRIILHDSPGVNSSENIEHAEISQKMLHAKKYRLLIYVINATQLGTIDEEHHLEVVKKEAGRTKILFVINKIDYLLTEDDNVFDIIERQRKFLISKGFRDPIICPVSSRAAYLVKKNENEKLSRIERREMDNLMDKFEQISLSSYYESNLHCPPIPNSSDEFKSLSRNCGFTYFEKIIEHLTNGGKINGTGLC